MDEESINAEIKRIEKEIKKLEKEYKQYQKLEEKVNQAKGEYGKASKSAAKAKSGLAKGYKGNGAETIEVYISSAIGFINDEQGFLDKVLDEAGSQKKLKSRLIDANWQHISELRAQL